MAVRDAAAYASPARTREKSTFGAEKSPRRLWRVLSSALLGPISSLSLGSFWCMNVMSPRLGRRNAARGLLIAAVII